jgi:hypothetical protein
VAYKQECSFYLNTFWIYFCWFYQALFDLEATNQELKADLRDLYITSAREIDIHGTTRKAIIVHVSSKTVAATLKWDG